MGSPSGDPVNYSDPFGLFGCKEHPETCADALKEVTLDKRIAEAGMLLVGVGEMVEGGLAALRIARALGTAETAVGNVAVEMGSAAEARLAGRLWTLSKGERLIRAERGIGEVIGRISGDATRVYRAPQLKLTGPNAGKEAANLIRKLGGDEIANTHLVIP